MITIDMEAIGFSDLGTSLGPQGNLIFFRNYQKGNMRANHLCGLTDLEAHLNN